MTDKSTIIEQVRSFAQRRGAEPFTSRNAFDAMDDVEEMQGIYVAINTMFKAGELARRKLVIGPGFEYLMPAFINGHNGYEIYSGQEKPAKRSTKSVATEAPPTHPNPLFNVSAQAAPITPAQIDKEHLAETFSPITNPTNPKDAIGSQKAPMSTVSAAVLAELGVAMLEGAAKYGRHNYRVMGVRASVYYDATLRHLFAWWEGEDIDPDSGVSHVTKAIASLVVLRDCMINGKFTDDRAPSIEPFYPRLNAGAAAILDKHADKQPRHYTIEDSK